MLPSDLTAGSSIAILQEVTEILRSSMSEEQREAVRTEEEARLALAGLLDSSGTGATEPPLVLDVDAQIVGGLLALLLADPQTAAVTEAAIADPPVDDQMSVVDAVAVTAVLAALVTLLQTKVQLHVERKGGEVNYSITMEKEAADSGTIRSLLNLVSSLFAGVNRGD